MKAVWLEDGQVSLRRDVPVPEPKPGELLVRVTHAGICSTDHGLIRGMYPFSGIPGHEFVGRVDEGPSSLVGHNVVGVISASCRACPTCLSGRTSHCPTRTVLGIEGRDGVFAQYATLPAANLVAVPESVPPEVAVFTEPLAAALEILEQVHIRPTDRVLLVGPGKLGQLVARVLWQNPCDLTVAGRSARSLDRLPPWVKRILSESVPRAAFDVVVECTGNVGGFGIARRAVRPAGTLVLKSTHGSETSLDMTMAVVDEITLVGSRCGPFEPAVRMLAEGRIDPTPLVDHVFPLDDAVKALDVSRGAGVLKVLMHCWE
jgi:threonine dehydrogenase-like Zn-dependent dehydrogenase